MNKTIEKLKYPIGKFNSTETIDKSQIENWISTIQNFPDKLKQEVQNLSEDELEKTYRPNGWTIR